MVMVIGLFIDGARAVRLKSTLLLTAFVVLSSFRPAGCSPSNLGQPRQPEKVFNSQTLGPGQAWSMHHKTLILGEFDLLINKTGLRAACKRSGITFVAQAPAWRAVAFSTRSGAIWRPAPVKFRPVHEQWHSLAVIGIPGIWLTPVVRTGQSEVSGFKCVSFATSDEWVRQQVGQLKQKLINLSYPRSAVYHATQLSLPTQAYVILEQIYGVPSCSLMPVEFRYTSFRKNETIAMQTNSCRIVTPAKDWLDIPQGLKTVGTFADVNMDKGAESGAQELFGN